MIIKLLGIFKREYKNLNRIEIDEKRLKSNFQHLKAFNSRLKIAPVLKSNAYGHGICEIAKILDHERAPFFCVDSLSEAYQLYKLKTRTPILIMGYTMPQNFKVKKLPFHFAVYDLEMVKILNSYQKGARIHIKIDTGMHRLGVQLPELPEFLDKLKEFDNLEVEGVMSHFASAVSIKDPLFIKQVKNFERAREMVLKAGFKPKWWHVGASMAIVNSDTRRVISKSSNLVRTGRAFYGLIADGKIKPILTLKTHLAQVKWIKKGESVGYDGTYKALDDTLVGILPIGYYDGVDRRLSNKGSVVVEGKVCPIIGRVSMNMTNIDVTEVENAKIGQEVIVYSSDTKLPNSLENCAALCGTISHDLLVHLSASTRRVVV